MREALAALLEADAAHDPQMVFITGDLGFSVVETLREMLGARFINAGVAEANLVSMAGALAGDGFHVYAYSIAPFMTLRCLEQIRNDVCYGARAVRFIGIGAGYSYGTLGPSHHSLEDAAVMAQLPGMRVISPATESELGAVHRALVSWDGPVYYRIPREKGPDIACPDFAADRAAIAYRSGADAAIVTSGPLLPTCLEAAETLARAGLDCTVLSVPVLAPFPHGAVVELLPDGPAITVFEGFEDNPLETGIMAALLDNGRDAGFARLNAGRSFAETVGGTDYQRQAAGLHPQAIVAKLQEKVRQGNKGVER